MNYLVNSENRRFFCGRQEFALRTKRFTFKKSSFFGSVTELTDLGELFWEAFLHQIENLSNFEPVTFEYFSYYLSAT